jgi:hypothetical protein
MLDVRLAAVLLALAAAGAAWYVSRRPRDDGGKGDPKGTPKGTPHQKGTGRKGDPPSPPPPPPPPECGVTGHACCDGACLDPAAAYCDGARCVPLGGEAGARCLKGRCDAGLWLRCAPAAQTCAPCGGRGQPCCGEGQCGKGLGCEPDGTCASPCGREDAPCCWEGGADYACDAPLVCAGYPGGPEGSRCFVKEVAERCAWPGGGAR